HHNGGRKHRGELLHRSHTISHTHTHTLPHTHTHTHTHTPGKEALYLFLTVEWTDCYISGDSPCRGLSHTFLSHTHSYHARTHTHARTHARAHTHTHTHSLSHTHTY